MSETKKTRVLFYKSKWGDGHIIDNIISLWTRSKYSHVEIWTDENELFTETIFEGYTGTCWTSTMRGDWDGTVRRDASKVLKNPDRWDYVEIEVPSYFNDMMVYMETAVDCNRGYAKWDILKFISPIHFPDNDRDICSEFVNNSLVIGGILKDFGIVSPKKVYQKLIAKGYKVKSMEGTS